MPFPLLIAFVLLALPAQAQPAPQPAPAGLYVADPAHTSVLWRIRHFGLSNYTARFTRVSAKLDWRPNEPKASKLAVHIDPASVRTDFPFPEKEDFDKKIGSDAAFLANKPISFMSESIVLTGKTTGRVMGKLTFRGQTHPATLDVTFNGSMASHPMEKVAKLGFSAKTRIRRSEWGLDFALGALSDEIEVAVETELMPETEAR